MKVRKQSQPKIQSLRSSSYVTLPLLTKKSLSQMKAPIDSKYQTKTLMSMIDKKLQKKMSLRQQIKTANLITSSKQTRPQSTPLIKSINNHIDKQINKHADISAIAYGVYTQTLHPLTQYNQNLRRQIASLTKLMTLIVSLKIADKFKVQINSTYFRVSLNAGTAAGTVAELDPKQWITVQDLLYGLMLPSGNDAAIVLAENFGAYLYYEKQGQTKALFGIKSLDITNDSSSFQKLYIENFINFMNKTAKQFTMIDTFYANPHGLDCQEAYSTVKDIAILLTQIIKNQVALRVISCQNYSATLKTSIGKRETQSRTIEWVNTHKLLTKTGYKGGKTGQTVSAGNCLATVYQKQSFNKDNQFYFIVVLGCLQRQHRFLDTEKLINKLIIDKN